MPKLQEAVYQFGVIGDQFEVIEDQNIRSMSYFLLAIGVQSRGILHRHLLLLRP